MLYDDNTTEDADAETIKEDVTINGERKIPGRQKVVRGSNVQVFNFARGSESTFVHCTQPYDFACQPLRGLVTSAKRELSMLNTKKRILAFCGRDFLFAKISRFKKSGILEMKEARYGEQERKRAVYDTEKNRCNDS